MTNKFCRKCSTEKPLSEFYDCAHRYDGKGHYCKDCTKLYNRLRQALPAAKLRRQQEHLSKRDDPQYKAAAKRRSEKSFQSVKGRAQSLLRCAKRSPDGCSLTLEWVMRGIERRFCPVTGIPFDLTNGHQKVTGRAKNPYAPSLDRIYPKGPYSPENTRVVIWQYNMMKGELSDREIFELCAIIVGAQQKQVA